MLAAPLGGAGVKTKAAVVGAEFVIGEFGAVVQGLGDGNVYEGEGDLDGAAVAFEEDVDAFFVRIVFAGLRCG
jgi:hypothetical protein